MEKNELARKDSRRSVEIAWLAIIFLVPLFFNPASHQAFYLNKVLLFHFLLIVLAATVLADRIGSGTNFREWKWKHVIYSPLHLSILAFGVIFTIATIVSITPKMSFSGSYVRHIGLFTVLCWIVFFLILANYIRSREQILRIVYTLLASSGVVAILGILQHFFPETVLRIFHLKYGGRVYSTTGNPLALSVFLAMVIPFNLSLIIWLWRKYHTRRTQVLLAGLCLLLVLQFWCLWLAQYSLTILLFLISSIAFVVLLGIVDRYKVILVAGVACVLAIVAIAAMLLIPAISSGVTPHAAEIDETAETTAAEEVGLTTLSWRAEYWKAAWDIIADPPDVSFSNDHLRFMRPLVGYGPETFVVTMQQAYPGQAQDRIPLFFKLSRPHNHYLYLATTIGVLGLMAFLAILAVFFYFCFRYVFRTRSELNRLLLIGAMASMTGFLADCLFNPETITGNLVFWLSLSVVPALIKPKRAESNCPGEMERTLHHSSSGSDGIRRCLAPVFVLLLMAIAVGITIRPFLADVYFQRGLNLNARGSPEAVNILEKAVELQPSETTYLGTIGMYYYHAARLTNDDSQASKYLALSTAYYQRAKDSEPLIAYHYHILADVYTYWAVYGNNEKWPVAFSLYDQALQLFPNNVLIANKWILALIAGGDLSEARVKLQRAVDIDPNWIGNLMCGLILMEQGDDSVQEVTYNMDVNKMNPRDLVYFIPLCRYIYASGLLPEFDRGVESYSEQVPNLWLSHAMLAVTSFLTADNDRGLAEFKTAIELAPDDSILYLSMLIQDLSRLDARLNTLLSDDTSGMP